MSSPPSAEKLDKILLAAKLKAYQEGTEIPNISDSWCFGMKMQWKTQQMPKIAFKGMGEIAVPVSIENSEKLKQSSQHLSNGLWEMALHFDKLDQDNPHVDKFLKQTIPLMTEVALRQLKVNYENLQELQMHPKKLTIMEPGAKLHVSPIKNSPGVFATMIVQFPIENGHQGGSFVVNNGQQSRTFENSKDSCRNFHYTAFLSDCSCQLEELTAGRRLSMTFDIACSDPSNLFPIISTAKEVTDLLQQFSPSDRLLAIPLKEGETTFSSLSSDARNLVGLFNSVNLEVRLAIVSQYRIGMAHQRTGCECCLKRRCPCQENIMAQVTQEKISTVKWLDFSDRELKLDLDIDCQNEIVGEGPLFFDHPSKEKINLQTWVLEQWYNRPVLVALHKDRSFQLDCLHGFDSLLDKLERRVGSKKEKEYILRTLQAVISFSCQHPEIAFKTESSSCRLLKLCIHLKVCKEIIKMLEIIAAHQGISSVMMTERLANAIQLIGSNASTPSIAKLISLARAQDQMHHYVQLATTLLDKGCHQAAVATASHICNILSSDGIISSMEISVLALCVDLLFRLDANPLTCHPQRLINLCGQVRENLSTFLPLRQLLACVQHCWNSRPAKQMIPNSAINWYYQLSLHLAQLEIPSDTPSEQMLSAVKFFVSIGDPTLLETFIQDITNNQNQSNEILQKLLALEDTWKFADESAEGKRAVSTLVDKRISWLAARPKPEPSWAFPDAVVVGHPLVQEFLRSENECMTYRNFENIRHARNWAREHFGDSDIAEAHPAGAGSRAYCDIHKTQENENGIEKYSAQQRERMSLIDKKSKRLADPACSVVNVKKEEMSLLNVKSENNSSENQSAPHPGPSSATNVVPQVDLNQTKANNQYEKDEKRVFDLMSRKCSSISEIEALVESGVNINCRNERGMTPLLQLLEVSHGNTKDILWLFIKNKVDFNAKDNKGRTALHVLCRNYTNDDRDEIARLLIRNGVDVNGKTNDGRTALHMLSKSHNGDNTDGIALLLIRNGVDVNAKNNNGRTALHSFCECSSTDNIKEIVQLLIANKVDINAKINGNERITENNGWTALMLLCECYNKDNLKEIIELLIANKVDVNAKGNNHGCTALWLLCRCYNYDNLKEIIEVLIANNVDVNAKTNDGCTAFHALCEHSQNYYLKETIELLMANKVDVNAKTDDGYNSLHNLCLCYRVYLHNYREIIELLINKVDINAKTNDGWTALTLLCNSSYKEIENLIDIIRLFIQHGVDVNAKDWEGLTAADRLRRYYRKSNVNEILKLLADAK